MAVLYSQASARDMQTLIKAITMPNKVADVWAAIHEQDDTDNMSV